MCQPLPDTEHPGTVRCPVRDGQAGQGLRQDLGELGKRNLASLPPFAGRPRGTAARLGERIGKSRAARRS